MTWLHTSQTKLAAIIVAFGSPILFIAATPWLKQQPDAVVYLFTGLAASGTILASFVLAIQKDQKLDEWHRSAARFSSQWGWLAGAGLVAVLLAVPALQNLIVALAGRLADVSSADQQLVLMAFLVGFMSVVLAQMICTLLLSAGWRYWMSRSE
jgi:hypothetical protein